MNPFRCLAALLLAFAGSTGVADAGGRPGDFDFYVLSLSWSPSYCEAEGRDRGTSQCERGRPYAFVVHGLWPQYDSGGYPETCRTDGRPTPGSVSAMLDLMPDPGLVRHEWRKHGSCSGLAPDAYFDLIRKARAKVTIPPAFDRIDRYVTVAPPAVETAFVAANPGLRTTGVAVTCDGRRLREVRLCLDRDLGFRDCPDIDRRDCKRYKVVLPPVR